MSVNSKMTAIANLIRTLMGKTDKMGLDAMENNLDSAVKEVDIQDDLIQQIKTALKGKTAGGGGDSDLPAGYRRADYIKFTGEQVVDLGIICNQDTKIQTYFTRESSAQKYLYGVSSDDNTASVTAYLGGSWRFGNKSSTKSVGTINELVGFGVYVDAKQISVTGSTSGISGVANFETTGTLLLGTCRSASGAVGAAQFVGKIFFFLIDIGGEQVRHLVPVTDGTVYRFWDSVSKNFFDSITDAPLGGGNL